MIRVRSVTGAKLTIIIILILAGFSYVVFQFIGPPGLNKDVKQLSQKIIAQGRCPESCNANNCAKDECFDCEFSCGRWCQFAKERKANAPKLAGVSSTACPLPDFKNITSLKLPPEDSYWSNFPSSGRPTHPETAPLFVDLNEDGVLDYFMGSHQNPLELAISVAPEGNIGPNAQATFSLQMVSHRIEPNINLGDKHGHNIVDLDGDGILDLLLSGGGGMGGTRNAGNSNKLFWGERGPDPITGEETTLFHGGTTVAEAAGISLKELRGRFNFVLDFNGDGLLDIFFAADRLKTDRNAPGVLMLNQDNRMWKAESAIREYSKALMISDVDGDGFANELILTRDFCYPQKKPPYKSGVVEFCKTRPVGTTAVFKYNKMTEQVDNIGKHYSSLVPKKSRQPPCCKPGAIGTFGSDNRNCHVRSLGSGDFDGDLLADQVFLYCSKLIFYFSSDRKISELPFGKRIIGSEVYLPSNCDSSALRIFDIDNNGTEEILVSCFQSGRYVLLTQGETFRDWSIDNGCNGANGLGDLKSLDIARVTQQDIRDIDKACDDKNALITNSLCNENLYGPKGDRNFKLKAAGVSNVDLNNDGFLDLIVAYKGGKMQFFENQTSNSSSPNRFIAFKLSVSGNARDGALGVGSTLILYSKDCEGCEAQFREVSSYQSATDKYGYIDDRIIFGLGAAGTPISILVRWPDGSEQTVDLQDWSYTRQMQPLTIVKATITGRVRH